MTIDRLRQVMAAVGNDPTGRELADVIWLATQLRPAEPTVPRPGQDEQALPTTPPPEPAKLTPEKPEPVVPVKPTLPPTQARPNPAPLPVYSLVRADGGGERALEVPVPAAAALGDRLAFQRALRPFARRVALPHPGSLDEQATAERIAAQSPRDLVWLPTWKPARERWLDCAVVVDGGSSMVIWRQLAEEVVQTLAQSGVFRDVQRWHLRHDTGTGGTMLENWSGARHRPAEIIDPTGRRVILIISDCVDLAWRAGKMTAAVSEWSRQGPVAILQPLPERLWARTGAPTLAGRLSTAWAAAPNQYLTFTPFAGMPRPKGIAVPVLQLSHPWLRRWTRVVGGMRSQTAAATFFAAGDRELPSAPSPTTVDPLRQVRQFRAVASADAFQLARYVAYLKTTNLPVIQHIHQAMFRKVRPAHLAEFLLSGLLQLSDPKAGVFEFIPEVPRLLLDSLTRNEASRVKRLLDSMISDSIEARIGLARRHFSAYVKGKGPRSIADPDTPFAVISSVGAERLRQAIGQVVAEPGPEVSRDLEAYHDLGYHLLAPQTAAARFVGRHDELARLRNWCEGSGPRVLLLTGPAGVGKTRLVQETCRSVTRQPLVIDDADQLSATALEARLASADVDEARLLIVARSMGAWWEEQATAVLGRMVRPVVHEQLSPLRLTTLAPSIADFSDKVCHRVEVSLARPQITNVDRPSTPLEAQLQALGELAAGTDSPALRTLAGAAIAATLRNHREYWERAAVAQRLSYRSAADLDAYVAVAVLYGAGTLAEATNLCRQLGASREAAHSFAVWIHDLYPGTGSAYWGPIGPREVQDALIIGLGAQIDRLLALLPTVDARARTSALSILARLATHYRQSAQSLWRSITHEPELIRQLWRVCDDMRWFPTGLLEPIRRSLMRPQTSATVVDAIVAGMGDQSILFRGCDPATAEELVAGYRRLMAERPTEQLAFAHALGHLAAIRAGADRPDAVMAAAEGVLVRRRLLEVAPPSQLAAERAGLNAAMCDLAEYQVQFGLRDDAAATAEAALRGFMQAQSEGDEDLAGQSERLARHGRLLADLGRFEPALSALEAVAARQRSRALSGATGLAALATSLVDLSALCRQAADPWSALRASSEAAALYMQLAREDAAHYRVRHADTLLHLGADLSETGSSANARACVVDAINLYRLPAEGGPVEIGDGIALAHYLLALLHSDLSQEGAAEETMDAATAEFGRLTHRSPGHSHAWALTLSHRAQILHAGGDSRKAVSAISQAVAAYQQILRSEPANADIARRLARCQELLSEWE